MLYLGLACLLISVFVGFLLTGGNIAVMFHPSEWLIIIGSAVGTYLIGNSKSVIYHLFYQLGKLSRGEKKYYNKEKYISLLLFLYNFFQFTHRKGLAEVEDHIEDVNNSVLFSNFFSLTDDRKHIKFFCDYFRMISLGFDNTQELDHMMDNDINSRRNMSQKVTQSLLRLADALPALGIVAAVIGVICAMASVGSDPAILGPKIASALVGTFIGAFSAYGIVSPIAHKINEINENELNFLECIRAGIIAHLSGYAPSIAIECARHTISSDAKPDFHDIELSISKMNK